MKPILFREVADLRRWFEENHAKETELWTRYYKVGSGKKSVNYKETLDEALCFGWIDGTSKGIDEESYMQRWTPRRKGSNWSAINIEKAKALIAARRMRPAGLVAFEAGMAQGPQKRYSFENRPQHLPPEAEAQFRKNKTAWTFWKEQPPGYRRSAIWFVVSAKKEETRTRRLAHVIAHSAKGKRIPELVSPAMR